MKAKDFQVKGGATGVRETSTELVAEKEDLGQRAEWPRLAWQRPGMEPRQCKDIF